MFMYFCNCITYHLFNDGYYKVLPVFLFQFSSSYYHFGQHSHEFHPNLSFDRFIRMYVYCTHTLCIQGIHIDMCTYSSILPATLYCISLGCVHAVCICVCFIFTVRRRWRSFVTWTWATDRSRCQNGRGRTLDAGYVRGS